MRRHLKKAAIFTTALAVCVLVCEASLRSIPSRLASYERAGRVRYHFNPYAPDGRLGFVLSRDWETVHSTEEFDVSVRTNGLGLRGAAATREKPAGTTRVVVVGDSFAFGFGVEDHETFPALLGERLQNVEVLNASVPGYCALHYYLWLMTEGFDLEPDLVLMAECGNDVSDLRWELVEVDEQRLPVRIQSLRRMIDRRGKMRYVRQEWEGTSAVSFPGQGWLADHSRLYHWVRYRLAKRSAKQVSEAADVSASSKDVSLSGDIATLSTEGIQRGLVTSLEFRLRYHRYLVDAIARECASRGITFRTTLVGGRAAAQGPLHGDSEPGVFDTAVLFPTDDVEGCFFPVNTHWTPRGHERVADALAGWLPIGT